MGGAGLFLSSTSNVHAGQVKKPFYYYLSTIREVHTNRVCLRFGGCDLMHNTRHILHLLVSTAPPPATRPRVE